MFLNKMVVKVAQRGVGLVEVLVALLVLAIGVLGYAGMQLSALKGAELANNRAQATLIAQDALERLQVNPDLPAYIAAAWPTTPAAVGSAPNAYAACTGVGASCTSAQMVSWDVNQLSWMAGNLLPEGLVSIQACPSSGLNCVVVSWEGMKPSECVKAGGEVNTDTDSFCAVIEVIR
ncbi:MAG: type IV pilus modification protein PilV [Alcanivorax sp.]|uniref:type IV pilus modification protein PilV n=1 Tax=Alcanivorax sp. TaxID=1872427 RepID=UPI003DA75FE4